MSVPWFRQMILKMKRTVLRKNWRDFVKILIITIQLHVNVQVLEQKEKVKTNLNFLCLRLKVGFRTYVKRRMTRFYIYRKTQLSTTTDGNFL